MASESIRVDRRILSGTTEIETTEMTAITDTNEDDIVAVGPSRLSATMEPCAE